MRFVFNYAFVRKCEQYSCFYKNVEMKRVSLKDVQYAYRYIDICTVYPSCYCGVKLVITPHNVSSVHCFALH